MRTAKDVILSVRAHTEDPFGSWKRRVDAAIYEKTGGSLTSDDLPDCPYRDWYDACVTPAAAARRALKRARE